MLDKIGPGHFRYFLCLVVVFFHSTSIIAIGEWAVHVFFILSGYWVIKMYKEKYISYKNPISSFYLSRLLRLLPVFYINLLLFIIVSAYVHNLSVYQYIKPVLENKQMAFSHISILGLSMFGRLIPPSWSLDIEMQFYILVPALTILLFTCKKYIKSLLIILLFLFSFIYLVHESWHLSPSIANYMCFFLVGVLIYETKYEASHKSAMVYMGIGVLLLLLTYTIPVLRTEAVFTNTLKIQGVLFRVIFDFILALLMVPFISRNIRSRGGKWDKEWANLSYVTYLFHWVMMVPWGFYYGNLSFTEKLPSFIVYLIATFVGSIIIYYAVDIPFERLRKKIVA